MTVTDTGRAARPIEEVAQVLGLFADEYDVYGADKAKIALKALDRRLGAADGKLVCVTSITPTKAGEGKTTTAVSLAEGLGAIGERPVLCLREPSMGPVFGIKGGGAGGGRARIVPFEDVNLHFTGDIHAIGAANNLLAAMVDAHLLHGNALDLDPPRITWRRCVDVNDRALRAVVTGLGGPANGSPRETGFDITAASEVMAIVAVARDLADLHGRLGAATIGFTRAGRRATAGDVRAAGVMTVLLKEALKPNLVRTLEGAPALVHTGPFANTAHGNNSLVADLLALKLGDYVVTESGFGSDMGFEKFAHIVVPLGGLTPSAVVLVATVRALKHHGGDPNGGPGAVRAGAENLRRHLEIIRGFGLDAVVAVNRFEGDSTKELDLVRALALDSGARAAELCEGFARGGVGASGLAEAVVEAAEQETPLNPLYGPSDPIVRKIEAVAGKVYGAAGVEFSSQALASVDALSEEGLSSLPVCMAKTPLSLSHDPGLGGSPRDFTLPVRDVRPYTGAGWLVVLCGDIQTMPGLGAEPAATRIGLDEDGKTVGLW